MSVPPDRPASAPPTLPPDLPPPTGPVPRLTGGKHLSPAAKELLARFERLWTGGRPAIDDFLAASPADERPAVLVELVHADLEFRLRAGEPARVEDYLG